MIKKIRWKFIAISLSSLTLILFIIILSINITNYVSVDQEGSRILEVLKENNGTFPDKNNPNDTSTTPPPASSSTSAATSVDSAHRPAIGNDTTRGMTAETPFQTRYFTVTFATDGSIIDSNVKNIASLTQAEAETMATTLYQAKKTSGYQDYYKYLAYTTSDNTDRYIFVDRQTALTNFATFRNYSLIISCAGLVGFALLVVLLSKVIVKPAIESEQKQKMFITDASHSLKTPLAIIQADNEVMESLNGTSKWTTSIANQVTRMSELTNQLVYLSRLDEGSLKQNPEDIDLSDLIGDQLESFRPVYDEKGIQIQEDIAKNIHYQADLGTMKQLCEIFLENASKYTPKSTWIKVSLHKKHGQIHLIFANAIDYEYQDDPNRLFDRFYRTDSSRNSQTGGTGLGLSIAKAIVSGYHGKIKASVHSKQDIVFEITL
jgi:two-component system, OmpR family, sensor histidine kinase CiaH